MRHVPYRFLAVLLLFVFVTSTANAFRFSPFRSKFEPVGPESNQLFLVENNTSEPVSVQIRIANRKIDVDGGETMVDNEKDFAVFPAQMILQSHSSRSVRVQWVGDPNLKEEIAYRIIAEQLPVNLSQTKPKASSVHFLVAYRGALFVTPTGLTHNVTLDFLGVPQDPLHKGMIELVLHNRGTQHALLRGLKLTVTDDQGNSVTLEDEKALKGMIDETILAKQRRQFFLPWPKGLHGTPKKAEFSFDKRAF